MRCWESSVVLFSQIGQKNQRFSTTHDELSSTDEESNFEENNQIWILVVRFCRKTTGSSQVNWNQLYEEKGDIED